MRKVAALVLSIPALIAGSPCARAQTPAGEQPTAQALPYVLSAIADPRNPWGTTLPIEHVRPLAPIASNSILNATPRVGPFRLTFYSDMPATGFDGMVNAEVVISLTRRF